MPIYEYTCKKCNHVTEALRTMIHADDPVTCEACGSDGALRKHSVFSAGASRQEQPMPPSCQGCHQRDSCALQ